MSAVSLVGAGAAVWAHAVSMVGIDPQSLFHHLWWFQLVLVALLLPVIVRMLRKGVNHNPLGIPKRFQGGLYALLFYYGIQFYVFLMTASDHLSSDYTWRMFSAGWLLLFTLTATFYWARYAER